MYGLGACEYFYAVNILKAPFEPKEARVLAILKPIYWWMIPHVVSWIDLVSQLHTRALIGARGFRLFPE